MPSKQKAKGNAFEREISKFLNSLYGESFTRVPNSGAYIGGKNSHRIDTLHEGQVRSFKGDIIPGQSFKKLNIECKSYKAFSFHLLLTDECTVLDKWIEQLLAVSQPGDFDVIFMKFNRIGKFVVTRHEDIYLSKSYIQYNSKKFGIWHIQNFETFWQHNTNKFKELCK